MALVDLKSKLNQFRGENNPNNPYQKSGKRDTDFNDKDITDQYKKLKPDSIESTSRDIGDKYEFDSDRKNLSDTIDGEGRQILGQTISAQASTFLKGLKQFGIIDIPIENNYENSIKRPEKIAGFESGIIILKKDLCMLNPRVFPILINFEPIKLKDILETA